MTAEAIRYVRRASPLQVSPTPDVRSAVARLEDSRAE
jgi:hypothetical protein